VPIVLRSMVAERVPGLPREAPARPAERAVMFLDLTDSQLALREELRAYFSTLITADERASMAGDRHNAAYRAVVRRMGRRC
jgi:hypothetical protein